MKKLIFPLLIILFLSACNPWKFVSEYNHNVDFTNYKTFGLLNWDPVNDKVVNTQTKEYILMSIKDEMEKRGYIYQKADAELQVSVYVVVQEETSYSGYNNHYAGYNGYSSIAVGVGVGSGGVGVGAVGYGMPMYPYSVVKHDYNMGTVVVDLLDHSKKQIVWQGVATGRIARETARESNVKRDIGRLFKKLPVKKIKE